MQRGVTSKQAVNTGTNIPRAILCMAMSRNMTDIVPCNPEWRIHGIHF
jgi:hypothetical protein